MSEQEYRELQPGEIIQEGDQWQNECGRWQPFLVLDGSRVQVRQSQRVRRPIRTTHQTTYEEVPGSRTTQDTVVQPHRERIAYEDLRVGDHIQDGDQWQNDDGRWQPFSVAPIQVRQGSKVRRPYKISTMLEIGDALASAQKAATQLQDERDEACKERDLARSEVARLSTELWARKPLEERVASLTHELANAREDFRKLVKTNTENADQFAEHTAALVQERDEARAKSDRLQGLIDDLLDEPTAKQVQDMLRTWATELDWSAGCFDSMGREQIDTIQKTLVAVIQRIETMVNPEGSTDGE